MAICSKCGKEYKYLHHCEYVCKCGKSFTSRQSYISHCGHCKENLGRDPKDRFGESRKSNLGKNISNKNKIPIEDILLGTYPNYNPNRLKYRLVNEGYKEWKCENCGLVEWLGKPIPLELHHKDGDNTKNYLGNLELLCPNCHSLTNNYRWKKKFQKSKEGSSD